MRSYVNAVQQGASSQQPNLTYFTHDECANSNSTKLNATQSMSLGDIEQLPTNRRKRPTPLGSNLLTDAENQQLFKALGSKRISLTAGVAQLFSSASRDGSSAAWTKQNAGAVAFVKDYQRKCYCIELFDIFNWALLWSQTLYKDFCPTFYPRCPRFIVFEGDKNVFGLNFADHGDADNFKAHLTKQSEHERCSGQRNEGRNRAPATHATRTGAQLISQTPQRPMGGITTLGTVAHFGGSTPAKPIAFDEKKTAKKTKNDKKSYKKPRHRKEDISNPTDFKHLVHLGWDQEGGLNQEVYETEHMDETVHALLRAAGQNAEDMNPEDIKFVYQFVRENVFDANNRPTIGAPMPATQIPPHHTQLQRMHTSIEQPYYYQHQQPVQQPQQWQKTLIQPQYSYQPPPSNVVMRQPPPRPLPILNSNGSYGFGGISQETSNGGVAYSRGPLPQPPQHIQKNGNGIQRLNIPPPPPPVPPTSRSVDVGGRPLVIPQGTQASSGPPPPPPPPPSSGVAHLIAGAGLASSPPPPPPPPPPNLFASGSATSLVISNGNNHPPPPPPPSAKPQAFANDRANLLQQIQAGKKLRHVDAPAPDKKPTPTNPTTARENLMDQIKSGSQLKHVDAEEEIEKRNSTVNVQDLGGIAGALARALEERRRNLANSDDSDDSDANNDSEWDD